jgi:predicted ArsR family transcriptional regulator
MIVCFTLVFVDDPKEAPSTDVSAVAALDEPTRRRLYDHVVRQTGPVSRDEAAEALGLARPTAAFHLDRLAEESLLDVVYERRSGRTGPGAGRPAKLYKRSSKQVTVTLPERHYELAGRLLAQALEESEATGAPARTVLHRRHTSWADSSPHRSRRVSSTCWKATGSNPATTVTPSCWATAPSTRSPASTPRPCAA